MNPLLGVVLLALVIGVVLIAEGIIETALFFALRDYRHAIWILIDGAVTLVLGIVACAHWPPASLGLVRYLVGMSFIRAAFPGSCWDLQFATSSQEKRRLHEGKLSRASRLASREQTAVTLSDLGLGLVLIGFALCRLPLLGCPGGVWLGYSCRHS